MAENFTEKAIITNFNFGHVAGKRWVECQKKQQISIPDNIDPETQVNV